MAAGRAFHLGGMILAIIASLVIGYQFLHGKQYSLWFRWLAVLPVVVIAANVILYPFAEIQTWISRFFYLFLPKYAAQETMPQPFILYLRAFMADQFVKPDVFLGEFSLEEELAYALTP